MRGLVRCAAPLVLLAACSAAPAVPAVPPVADVREVRGVDPCTLAGPEALAEAGVAPPGVPTAGPDGAGCTWRGVGARLSITPFPGELGALARGSDATTTRVRLAGRPALETFTGAGEFCQYDVAVADDQSLLLALDGGRPDSCTALQALAPGLLDTLPGG